MRGLIAAHSGLRYIVLLLLVIAVVNALLNLKSGKFSKKDKLINLFAMVVLHIQLLLGLALYFISPKVKFGSDTMSESIFRFFTVEHLLLMLIGIILVTLGYSKSKRQEDLTRKHQLVLRYYGLGLIIIFLAIPWPFIYNVGAGYF
ncbi:MAG TPA: hypothetical protein VKX31_04920 [Brumimicrobium sp.]|nr:hypothetical protein [Brumimicrobium sp.]